ncbi:MAG: DUF484 family protein [Pseudomonadota bacterium]
MSQSTPEIGAGTGIALNTDERDLIRSLLLADPNLVLDDDQVMRALLGATEHQDRQVVDLRDKLVERLEQRLSRLVEANRSVIAAAYENVASTEQIHRAILLLLSPCETPEFLRRLTRSVPSIVGVDEARLCLEADVEHASPAAELGPELGDRVVTLPVGTVDAYLMLEGEAERAGVVLRGSGEEAELIFGGAVVRSEALMPLRLRRSRGLLAFGSRDPDRFSPDQGVDLLTFFAEAIELLLTGRLYEQR